MFFIHAEELESPWYDVDDMTSFFSNSDPEDPWKECPDQDIIDIEDDHLSDLIPTTLAVSKQINEVKGHFVFKTLLNHRGSHVLIQRRCLPKNAQLFQSNNMNFKTTAGTFNLTQFVYIRDVCLPEFSYS